MKKYRIYLSDGRSVDISAESLRGNTSTSLGPSLELLDASNNAAAAFANKAVIGYAELVNIIEDAPEKQR